MIRLLKWLAPRSRAGNGAVTDWRRQWHDALATSEPGRAEALARALDALGLPEDEIEIEREMLDGLLQLSQLQAAVAAESLPIVETGHRVIGPERCHFSAPASMPDDAAQPAGRLLFTGTRAVFVGSGRTVSVKWHAVDEARHAERDIVLVTRDRRGFHRFRCNSFADALCGAFLGRRLAKAQRERQPSSGSV